VIHQLAIEPVFDLLALHVHNPQRYPHLLESSATGAQGRYDILFAFPGESLVVNDSRDGDFLRELDARWARAARGQAPAGSLPFRGGWFVYLAYELAAQIEPQLALRTDVSGLPLASATRIPAAVIRDRLRRLCWIVAEEESYLPLIRDDIAALRGMSAANEALSLAPPVEDEPQPYLDAVARVLQYIRDGDVFQVNLSRQWQTDWPRGLASATLYDRLRRANPGPFSGLATWGDRAIISSSPERLVEVRGERVQTRPIAGTRPRGDRAASDRAKSDELLRHPKEQAEHIMLIDLERNDLGRVARPGTVRVNELMTLESYATVHHIVSNVEARLRAGVTPGEVIRAVFPGGTITGCPKVRCMQIIAELEQQARGAYTGSIGYLNHDGSMDLNILIRTIVRGNGRLGFRAGAGIVYDSDPWHELDETRDKAAGLLRATGGGAA
jgi:4-amino-4-deoxychorismate synthase (2-amino-4-deoxychorismate-forming) component I